MVFSFISGVFRVFFGRKIRCQKLAKSKANFNNNKAFICMTYLQVLLSVHLNMNVYNIKTRTIITLYYYLQKKYSLRVCGFFFFFFFFSFCFVLTVFVVILICHSSSDLRFLSLSAKQRKMYLESKLIRTVSSEAIACSNSFCFPWIVFCA